MDAPRLFYRFTIFSIAAALLAAICALGYVGSAFFLVSLLIAVHFDGKLDGYDVACKNKGLTKMEEYLKQVKARVQAMAETTKGYMDPEEIVEDRKHPEDLAESLFDTVVGDEVVPILTRAIAAEVLK